MWPKASSACQIQFSVDLARGHSTGPFHTPPGPTHHTNIIIHSQDLATNWGEFQAFLQLLKNNLCLMQNFIFLILTVSISVCYFLSSNHGIFLFPTMSVICYYNYSSYIMTQLCRVPRVKDNNFSINVNGYLIYPSAINTCSHESTQLPPKCPIVVGRRIIKPHLAFGKKAPISNLCIS